MPVTDWKPARFVVSTTGYGNYNTSAETIYNSIANGQAWSTPKFAGGFSKQFEGTYMQVSNSGNLNATLNGSDGFTIGAWGAPDSTNYLPIFYRGTEAATDRVSFGMIAGTFYVVVDSVGVVGYGYNGQTANFAGNQYWCMVYSGGGATDADRLKLYSVTKTGEVKQHSLAFGGTIPATAPTSSYNARIGSWDESGANHAFGLIGHLQVIDHPMSSGEIATNALSPSASLNGTKAYWSMTNPLDEPDLSGNSNHAHGRGVSFPYAENDIVTTVAFGSVTAGVGVASKWLDGSNFEFGIPTNYIIDQIDTRVKIDVSNIGAGQVHIDNVIRLQDYYHPRYSGGHDAYSSTISGDYYMVSVPASAMLDPGIERLSYGRVNQMNFGMAYAVRISGSTTTTRTVGVDSMEMRVWYSTPTGGLPLYTYGLDSQSSGLPLLVVGYLTSSDATPLYTVGNTNAAQGMNLFLDSHPFSSSAGLNQGVKAPTSKIRCFDGVDDYGYIPSGSALNSTDKLTVATWFYSSGPSTFPVFAKGEQGVGTTWYKYNDSTDNRLAGYMGTGNFSFPNGGLIQSGWNFAAVVYDGTAAQALRLKSYINGAESTASEGIPAAIPTHTDDVQVVKGRVGDPLATEIGNTRLSHYHIYTGVLSAAQIEQVRTEPLSYTTNLWAYYKMIGTGTWEHDYSNNGRHMQISGASSCNLSEVNYDLGMPGAIFEQFNTMPMYLTAVTGIDGFRAATGMNMYVQVVNPTGWLSMPLHTYSAHLATGGMPLVIPSSIGQSTKGVTLFSAGY